MNEYTQEQETEIVRDAMTLTTSIQIEQEELTRLKAEQFKSIPAAPKRKILDIPKIEAQIPPPPKTKYSFTDYLSESVKKIKEGIKSKLKYVIIIGIVLLLLLIVVGVIMSKKTNLSGGAVFTYLFSFVFSSIFSLIFPIAAILFVFALLNFSKKKKEINEQLARSPEYLKAVENAKQIAEEKQQKAKEETAQKQSEIDAQYEADLEHYNNVTVPNYNKERNTWNEKQAKKINALEEDMALNEEILESLYDTTRKISKTYRELWILRWIYDDMNSSDHDIRYATELLDRGRQRLATEQSGRMVKEAVDEMHSSMMSGFNAVYEAIEDGNEELAKMHRDQNIANAINIAQKHNLNKTAKSINKST